MRSHADHGSGRRLGRTGSSWRSTACPLWLEAGGKRLPFDTGQGHALQHNADVLAIPLSAADAVLLSHGHYDHAGGLAAVLASRSGLPVYAQPEAAEVRYSGAGSAAREIGMPAQARQALLLRHVESITGGGRVHAMIGGMHLASANALQLESVVRALGDRCGPARVGSVDEFDE